MLLFASFLKLHATNWWTSYKESPLMKSWQLENVWGMKPAVLEKSFATLLDNFILWQVVTQKPQIMVALYSVHFKIQNWFSFGTKTNSFCIHLLYRDKNKRWLGLRVDLSSLSGVSCTYVRGLQKDWLLTVDSRSSSGSCFKGLYSWLIYIFPLSHHIPSSASVSSWTSPGIMRHYIHSP